MSSDIPINTIESNVNPIEARDETVIQISIDCEDNGVNESDNSHPIIIIMVIFLTSVGFLPQTSITSKDKHFIPYKWVWICKRVLCWLSIHLAVMVNITLSIPTKRGKSDSKQHLIATMTAFTWNITTMIMINTY